MARRKAGAIVAAAVVLGGVALATTLESGSEPLKVDSGGGAVPAASGEPAPYAISTLAPIGTAAQDPGGGGGGTGEPGSVAPPAIQGAQGSGSAPGQGGNDGRLYLSGANLLDPNRSAATTGNTSLPNPLVGVAGLLPIPGGNGSTTGCADEADEADYYAVPLTVETVGFSGTPSARIRISGSGPVSAVLMQMSPNGACQTISSGSGSISGGVATFSMSPRRGFQFSRDFTPALVISAPGSHIISTDHDNPSYIALPGLYGV